MRFSQARSGHIRKSHSSHQTFLQGTSQFTLIVVALAFFLAGGLYIFSMNQRAVYGYHIRTVEKDLAQLKKKNAELRLQEAASRSLDRVEIGSQNLRMEKAVSTQELIISAPGPIAYR